MANTIIKKPIVTEKSIANSENFNKYTFEVDMKANAHSAAAELKKIFNISKVLGTNTLIRLGKKKGRSKNGKVVGKRSNRKIMVFTLPEGESIDLFKQ